MPSFIAIPLLILLLALAKPACAGVSQDSAAMAPYLKSNRPDPGAGYMGLFGMGILLVNRLLSAPYNWNAARVYGADEILARGYNPKVMSPIPLGAGLQGAYSVPLSMAPFGPRLPLTSLQLGAQWNPVCYRNLDVNRPRNPVETEAARLRLRVGLIVWL